MKNNPFKLILFFILMGIVVSFTFALVVGVISTGAWYTKSYHSLPLTTYLISRVLIAGGIGLGFGLFGSLIYVADN